MSRPQRKRRRVTEEARNHPGPPSLQKSEPTQPLSFRGLNAANSDGNAETWSPELNPVAHGDFTHAEENSEMNNCDCETSESALLYLAPDDTKDQDWLPPFMAKRSKRKTHGPTSKCLFLDDHAPSLTRLKYQSERPTGRVLMSCPSPSGHSSVIRRRGKARKSLMPSL